MDQQITKPLSQVEHILDYATTQFMSYGIKSVSMDDIASNLGISKKTLYQYFNNKRDLVSQTISRHVTLEENVLHEIAKTAVDAIDEMAQIGEHIVIHFRQTKPALIHDLQKYYRNTWNTVVNLQSIFMQKKIEENIERGKIEGFYRQEVDANIIAKLYVTKSFSLVDEQLFSLSEYPRDHLVSQHLLYHLYGLLTEKGRTHINSFPLFKDYR